MGRGQALSYEDYIPYQGPRVAGFSPEQLGAQEGYKALAQRDMPWLQQAGDIAGYAATQGPRMAQSGYQAGPISSQFGGAPVRSTYGGSPIQNRYQAGPFQSTYAAAPISTGVRGWDPRTYQRASRGFGGREAQRYMSPYLSNVMDRQQRRAVSRFQEDQQSRAHKAVKSGAFGGSRQAVGDFLARRDLNDRLGDIEAQQLEKGFGQAQQQFERDRTARMAGLRAGDTGQLALAQQRSREQIATEEAKRQAASQNLQAQIAQQKAFEAAGGQSLQAQMAAEKARQAAGGQSLQAQIAQMKGLSDADARRLQAQIAQGKFGQAAGQMDLQAQIAADKAREAQGRQSLQAQLANQKAWEAAMGRGLKGAGVLGGLQKQEQALDMQRLKALSDVGAQRQALLGRTYDTAYEDFLRQRDYPYQQLSRYSSLLQGIPVGESRTDQYYKPSADPTAQLMQTGLGAYGMMRGMGGFG